jgi:hypothetical protein
MAEATERKRKMDRERAMAKRREAGSMPRKEYEETSLTQTRPWELYGISRATYYRWNQSMKRGAASEQELNQP